MNKSTIIKLCLPYLVLLMAVFFVKPPLFNEAKATVAGEAALSGSCDDPVIKAFVSDITFTISFPAVSASDISSCTGSAVLSGSLVNGDSNPSVTCLFSDQPNSVVLYSRTPTMKFGGLQCNEEDRVTVKAHGDGTSNPDLEVAFETTSETSWASAKRVDDVSSGSPLMLVGSSGTILSAALIDGDDYDDLINGEVALGGTVASEGASRLFARVYAFGNVISTAATNEIITLILTAQ